MARGGAKFSPTWEVEGELDLLIRKSAPPLGKRVRRGEVHARSSSSSVARSLASLVTTHVAFRESSLEPSQPCALFLLFGNLSL